MPLVNISSNSVNSMQYVLHCIRCAHVTCVLIVYWIQCVHFSHTKNIRNNNHSSQYTMGKHFDYCSRSGQHTEQIPVFEPSGTCRTSVISFVTCTRNFGNLSMHSWSIVGAWLRQRPRQSF